MAFLFSAESQLQAISDSLTHIRDELNLGVSVRLWNGQVIPLGVDPNPNLIISVSEPGVVGALVRLLLGVQAPPVLEGDVPDPPLAEQRTRVASWSPGWKRRHILDHQRHSGL